MAQTTSTQPVTSACLTFDTDVLIVGAGPTGLTLAAALAAARRAHHVIDRLAEGANTSRAAVVHARTLEVLEPLGVRRALVGRGLQAQRFTIRDRDRVLVPIAFDRLPTRYPYTLMVSQAVTEGVLLERFVELGGRVLRPRTLATCARTRTARPRRSTTAAACARATWSAPTACTAPCASVRASRSRAAATASRSCWPTCG